MEKTVNNRYQAGLRHWVNYPLCGMALSKFAQVGENGQPGSSNLHHWAALFKLDS